MADLKLIFKHLASPFFNGRYVGSQLAVSRFNKNTENTYLISFPRTGSHWLRMLIELYFERPLLTRTFFFSERRDFLLLHSHDMDLQVRRRNVIYLFRDPVDTVYSQLKYHEDVTRDKLAIIHWSNRYACHLVHWLEDEEFTVKKTIVQYEKLKSEPYTEFSKITKHFNKDIDIERLERCLSTVSKERVKQKTKHDAQVVNFEKDYEKKREEFRTQYGSLVQSALRNTVKLVYNRSDPLFTLFPDLGW